MEPEKAVILIIEDDFGLNELMSYKVESVDFQPVGVHNGASAIEWLKTNKTVLMVLDYGLPDMNGKGFITELQNAGINVPPFIVSTGQGDERIAVEMMKLGAKDYIAKDKNFLELLPTVINKVTTEIENENKLRLAEQALKQSETNYRILLESSGLGVGVYGLDGKIQLFNQKALDNLGGKIEDYVGKTLVEVFGEELGGIYYQRVLDAVKSETSLEFEDNFPSPSGNYWFLSNHTKILNANNEIIGVQVISHDITTRKKIEEVNNFLISCGIPGADDNFFDSLAKYLSKTFEMEYVCIDLLDDNGTLAHTVSVYYEGKYETNYSYHLKDTPCAEVVGKTFCIYPTNVSKLFPLDFALQDMKAESYFGTTLWDFEGKAIGLIAVIGRKPIQNLPFIEAAMKLVAVKAAGELERKRLSNDLLESEQLFSDMAINSAGVIYRFYARKDGSTGFYYMSPKVNEVFGYSDDFSSPDWNLGARVYPEDKEKFFDAISKSIAEVSNFNIEIRVDTKFGIKWIQFLSQPIEKKDEIIFNGIMIDVTERKIIEEKLELTKQSYLNLINTVTEAIFVLDETGTYIEVNKGAELMFLQDKDYFIGKTPIECAAKGCNDIPKIKEKIASVFETGISESFECWSLRGNGEIFPKDVIVSKGKYFDKDVMVLTARDISERKQAEATFKDIIDKNPMSIQILDMEGYTIQTNTAHTQLFGRRVDTNYSVFNDQQLLDQGFSSIFQKLKVGEVVHFPDNIYNIRNVNPSNPDKDLWIKAIGFPLLDKNGKPEKLVIMHQDITERKQSEKALFESEKLYRNLVEMIPDGVYKSTKKGKFIDVNPAMVSMLGYNNKEELMAIDIKRELYFHEDDRESLILDEDHKELGIFCLRKKDGSEIWVEDHGWYNTDKNGQIIEHEGVLRDITQRRQAEEKLLESKKKLKETLLKSSELIEITAEKNHYQKVTDFMLEISGAKYVSFSLFYEYEQTIETVAISGVKEHVQKLASFMGFDVMSKKKDNNSELLSKIFTENLTVMKSVTEAFGLLIPKTVCALLTKTFNLGEAAFVKVHKNNIRIGEFVLVFAKDAKLQNAELVELFANQVGLFVERKKTEDELNTRMEELMRFQRLTVGRELTMIELKKEVNNLLIKTGDPEKYNIVS